MSPDLTARSQMKVPPRFSRRLTADAFGFDRLREDLAEHDLLGEILRADDDRPSRRASASHSTPPPPMTAAATLAAAARAAAAGASAARARASASRPSTTSASAAAGIAPARIIVGVDHRQPAEDVLAKSAGTDRRGDRRGADADHRGDTNSGDDRRQRQRQLDHEQQLPRRHAHRHAGLEHRAIETRSPAAVVRMIGSSA